MLYTIKRYIVIFVFIIVIIIGLFFFRSDHFMEAEFESTLPEDDTTLQMVETEDNKPEIADVDTVPTKLVVDIKGAVINPGVYELDVGKRVVDLIDIAGGFTDQALDKEINLAQKLTDEMVIYIPMQGEEIATIGGQANESTASGISQVRVNDASEEELITLNGVGPSKAQAIIAYREEHGPFQHIDELLEISGIGEKTLENFKDAVIVP